VKTRLKLFLISQILLITATSFGQSAGAQQDLLQACLDNNTLKVYKLLGEGVNLESSREGSYQLYKLLANQTKFKDGLKMENFEVVSTGEYYLRKPEDIQIFLLLLRAGADNGMHRIEGKDISGISSTPIGENSILYQGGESINNAHVVYQSETGSSAFEYAKENRLESFTAAYDLVSIPLLNAVKNLHEIKELIDSGSDINQASPEYKFTALYIACQYGNQEIISYLLEHGANPNLQAWDGTTPMCAAAYTGNIETARKLQAKGAVLSVYSEGSNIPLQNALVNNHSEFIRFLVKNGVETNVKFGDEELTPLYYACEKGMEETVKLLLSEGADPEMAIDQGQTPLLAAAHFGHENIVKILVEAGADVNGTDIGFHTPLIHAYTGGYNDIVIYLLNKGADPAQKDENGWNLFHFAAYHGNVRILEELLKAGMDPNQMTPEGITPLMMVTLKGDVDAVKLLLNAGADPNLGNKAKKPPLQLAPEKNDREKTDLILQAGGNPNELLDNGNTVFSQLVIEGNLTAALTLLEHNADINATNSKKQNLLFRTDSAEIIHFLVEHGIDMNATDISGQTALTAALKDDNKEKIRLLISAGADMTNSNRQIDIYKTNKAFLEYLKDNGARFTIRDRRFQLGEPGYMDADLLVGMGLVRSSLLERNSWPFNAGIGVGIVPIYRFKINAAAMISFIGFDDIYFINTMLTPTVRYCLSHKGYFIGAGGMFTYILDVSSKEYPEIELGPHGITFAPYLSIGYEDLSNSFELGYKVRNWDGVGILYFTLGYDFGDLY